MGNNEGKIVIGTEVDTSGVEEGLISIEELIKNKEEELGRKLTEEEKQRVEEVYAKVKEKADNFNDIIDEIFGEKRKIDIDFYDAKGKFIDFANFVQQYENQLGRKITQEELDPLTEVYEKARNIASTFENVSNKASLIGKSLNGVVKKVVKWGLAVFSIRSAYLAVRNAMNTLTQYDDQLKADVDYIRSILAFALEPVVRKLVEWAKQLVFYLGYLIKQWTGYDIFANANKNLEKSVGSAKELNKQLAGFDEMNVISDTSGGGAGGGAMPSFNFEDMEVPDWLLTIEKIGKWVLENWQDVVMTLLLVKLFFDLLTGNWLAVFLDALAIIGMSLYKIWDSIKVIKDNFIDAVKVIWELIINWGKQKIAQFLGLISLFWSTVIGGINQKIKQIELILTLLVAFWKKIISTILDLFKSIGGKVGDAIGGAFKAVINGVLWAVENILNFPIRQINKLLDVINKVPGINISKLSTFSFPRLAKGGIINMPGRGVPVGSAIGGERGQEGVIPLTDSQQMALLGEAIGKYININATVPVYVGNRMVAREIKRINAEDNFAYNR